MRTYLLLFLMMSLIGLSNAGAQSLPADWQSLDIGFTDTPGEAYVDSATGYWVVKGSGWQMWENRDDFHFAYQQLIGDFEAQVQVVSHTANSTSAKAGIEIRASLDTNALHVLTGLEPWGGAAMVSRDAVDGESAWNGSGDFFPPYWVRVERVGDMLTGLRSIDGTTWETIEVLALPNLPDSLYVGLAVHANAETLSEAEFDNYSLNGQVATSLESQVAENFTLAPNPVEDLFSINFSATVAPKSYIIVNSRGQRVQQGKWKNEPISVGFLPTGLYTILLEGDRLIWSKRFLKN